MLHLSVKVDGTTLKLGNLVTLMNRYIYIYITFESCPSTLQVVSFSVILQMKYPPSVNALQMINNVNRGLPLLCKITAGTYFPKYLLSWYPPFWDVKSVWNPWPYSRENVDGSGFRELWLYIYIDVFVGLCSILPERPGNKPYLYLFKNVWYTLFIYWCMCNYIHNELW